MTPSIYTWGYGRDMYELLTAVALFVADLHYLVATVFAMGIGVLIFKAIFGTEIKYLFIGMLLVFVLFVKPSSMTFLVEDETNGYAHGVNNLPIGIGFALSMTSNFEKAMSVKIKTAFSTPSAVAMENAGIGFSMAAHIATESAMPDDDLLVQTFNQYVNNCFLSALASGDKTMSKINASGNLIGDLAGRNTYETLIYDLADPTGREDSCVNAWANISTRVGTESNSYIQKKIMPYFNMPIGSVENGLAATAGLLYGVSTTAKSYLMQQMTKNLLNNGLVAVGDIVGGDAARAAYAKAAAAQSTKGAWMAAGNQAKQNFPMVRVVGTALLVSLIPLVALIAIAMMSWKALLLIPGGLFAMALWQPIGSIINYLYYNKLEEIIPPIVNNTLAPLNGSGYVGEAVSQYLANLEWWYTAIPMISYVLVTGGGMAGMYLLRDAAATSQANNLGENVGKGNVNMGNSNVGNHTHNNDRFDTGQYVTPNGTFNKVDTLGGGTYSTLGADDSGTTYMQTTRQNATGGGGATVETQGSGTVSLDGAGNINGFSGANWGAGVQAAQQYAFQQAYAHEQQAGTRFDSALAASITDGFRNGSGTTDASTLTTRYGLTSDTATTLATVTSESVGESFNTVFTEKEQMDILKRAAASAGVDVEAFVKAGTPLSEALGSGVGVKATASGNVEISGTRADGSQYSFGLTADESKRFMTQYEKTLADNIHNTEGLNLNIAKDMNVGSSREHAELRTAQDNFLTSHADTERSEQIYSKVHRYAQDHKVDLSPRILQEFIRNDAELWDRWQTPGSNHGQIAASAAKRIQDAQQNPGDHVLDAKNVRGSIDTVYRDFATENGLPGFVDGNIKTVDTAPIQEGKDKIEKKNIPPVQTTLDDQKAAYEAERVKREKEVTARQTAFTTDHALHVEEGTKDDREELKFRVNEKNEESVAQPVIDTVQGASHSPFPDFSERMMAAKGEEALSKAQAVGLITNNWFGGEDIKDESQFKKFSTEDLEALKYAAHNSFSDTLSDEAIEKINKEIRYRERHK